MKLLFAILFSLFASQVDAATYWISRSGNDANACFASVAKPTVATQAKRSIVAGLGCLAGGDTLKVEAGTYTEIQGSTSTIGANDAYRMMRGSNIPSGPSSSQKTTIECETVPFVSARNHPTCILQPAVNNVYIIHFSGSGDARQNISWRGFKISNTSSFATQNSVLRISGSTCTNCEWKSFSTVSSINMANGGSPFVASSNTAFCNNALFEDIWIDNWEQTPDTGASGSHGIYHHCTNSIMRDLLIENQSGLGIQFYSSSGVAFSGGLIERFLVLNSGRRGIYVGNSNTGGAVVQYGVVKNSGTNASGTGEPTGAGIYIAGISAKVYHTVSVNNYHAGINCGVTCTAKNNIALDNGSSNIIGVSDASNRTTGTQTALFVSPSTNDFNLLESSAAIDAGTTISGLTSVGSAPDQGAYEACIRNKGVVENDEPTHYHIAYTCPVQSTQNGVTLQTPTVGNWTMVVAGVSKTLGNGGLVSAAISGLSTVEVVLASAVTNGQSLTDAMTRSASPTLTDSFAIGGVYAKVRTHAAASGTNNVGAAPSHVVVQSRFRFHKLRGAEDAAVVQCATCTEDVPITLPPGAAFRLRVKFRSDDSVGSVYNLRYSKDAGAYTLTPDAMGADFISWYGITADTDIPAAGTPTTELLTSDEANTACAVIRTSSDYPNIALNNSETECEYVLKISTSAPVGTTYDFRIYDGSGSAIDTYTNTPRLTVGSYTMMES